MAAPEGFRPEDSILWKIWPELAASMKPSELVAIQPGPDDRFTPDLELLRRLNCPTVVRRRPLREAS
jgi:hypothetical protein